MPVKKGQWIDQATGDILYPQTSYDLITDKPETFPPSSHSHPIVNGKSAGLAPQLPNDGGEKVLHGDGTWKDQSDFYVDTTLQKKVTAKTSRNASASKVKIQLQDDEGRAMYIETSADNIYVTSGRFSGQLLNDVLERAIVADAYANGELVVDVPDNVARDTLDPEEGKEDDFIVEDDIDPGFSRDILKGESR